MQDQDRNTEPLQAAAIEQAVQAGRRQPSLLVLKGPEQGAIYRLDPGVIKLGRSAGQADLVLLGPGLSRVHAELQLNDDGTAVAKDMGSTNGMFINGEKAASGTLRDGDSLALGPEVVLQFQCPVEAVHSVIEDLYKGATRDGLTGVLNRKTFMQRLDEEHAVVRRYPQQPACLAILDADHFKSVNDTHGHPAGDAVLIELARRISEATRTEDVVARFGGEEFVVLTRSTPLEGALLLLDRMRASIEGSPFTVPTPEGDKGIKVTISAGVAPLDPAANAEDALKNADQALYAAKHGGRNRVVPYDGR